MIPERRKVQTLMLGPNHRGQDYIVGDIHGCFDQLISAMELANFDTSADRLFSVGDLVDRGPYSDQVLEFLQMPFVHAVRGNHEDMLIEFHEAFSTMLYLDEDIICRELSKHGSAWWLDVPEDRREKIVSVMRKLPIAIEVQTPRGTIGIVHADVPNGMTWRTFMRKLSENDPVVVETALWGRSRIRSLNRDGVEGIGRVFVGHTIGESPVRLGNVYAIDTGAFRFLEDGKSRLSMLNLICSTGSIKDQQRRLVPSKGPFGHSLEGLA